MPITPSKWRGKYKTLKEYYQTEYDGTYYEFDRFQLTIDPDETLEEIEAYSKQRQDQETIKCAHSFAYWCHKYVKILHPMRGLVPFGWCDGHGGSPWKRLYN